jgi:hypothetical protein
VKLEPVKPERQVSYLKRHFERVSELHYRCFMCGKKVHKDGLRAHMERKHADLLHVKPNGDLEVRR